MQIEFFNITSYCGISSNAEHFYVKHLDAKYLEETLQFTMTDRLEELAGETGEELRYIPTKEEAESIARKDYPDYDRTLTPEKRETFREITIGDLLETGTTRFPSVMRIIREVRRQFPDAVLYFMAHGSRKDFKKWCMAQTRDQEELEELLCPDRKTNNVKNAKKPDLQLSEK
jgi:hypothetical protein